MNKQVSEPNKRAEDHSGDALEEASKRMTKKKQKEKEAEAHKVTNFQP